MSDTVAVTGATGFIGGALCRELAGQGWRVRALGRRDPGPTAEGVAYHRTDLFDAASLRPALAGVTTVIHLAARVHVMDDQSADPLAEFRRVNVRATEVLLDEAARAGVTRFVFASSVKAVGESSELALTETTPPDPQDPYGRSKLEAEQVVRRASEEQALDTVVLRLPLVYGPGMKGNMLRLFRAVDRRLPLPLALVRNRRSLAFLGNVAEAVLAVLRTPGRGARTYFVSDEHDVSTPELLRAIGRALGREPRLLPVPPSAFRVAGRVGDVISTVRPLPLTTAAVDRLLGTLVVDSSALRRATGFLPPYTLEEGLAITAKWYRLQRERV